MSNSVPPEQRPPRLRDDEPISILVALLAFGAIFAWAFSQSGNGLNLLSWLNGAVGTATNPSPLVGQSPSSIASSLSNPLLEQSKKGSGDPQNGAVAGKKGDSLATDDAETTEAETTAPGATAAATGPSPAPGGSPVAASPSPGTSPTPAPDASSPGTLQGGQRPIVPPSPSAPPIEFADVPSTYWAYPFIRDLSTRGVVGGFPDGSFQPDQPVTRGQFAVQLQKAFTKPDKLAPKTFADVPQNFAIAVDKAVKSNFMSGYPDGSFRPEQNVSRTEAAISLIRGLGIPEPADPEAILQAYDDQAQVPRWARAKIAAAIQAKVFSGDPDTMLLNPNQPATRADIAAFVYKGLGLPDPSQ